jgi:hypothetical protein
MNKLTTLGVILAFTTLACDARTLVGTVPDGSAGDDGGSRPPSSDGGGTPASSDGGRGTCTPVVFPEDQPFTYPSGVAGNWTGYFQAYNLRSGSDAVNLSLGTAADGSNQIHVVLGAGPPPPPATSATEQFPPGTLMDEQSLPDLIEGFSYLAHGVKWQGQRLTFLIATHQPWEPWCALQTSYRLADSTQGYNCVPGSGGVVTNSGQPNEECIAEDGNGTVITPVPCTQFFMCGFRICQCDACGCAAESGFRAFFDITFTGDAASGATQGVGPTLVLSRATN